MDAKMVPKIDEKSSLGLFFVSRGGLLGRIFFDEILVGKIMTTNLKNDDLGAPMAVSTRNFGAAGWWNCGMCGASGGL